MSRHNRIGVARMSDDKLIDEPARLAALRRYEARESGDNRPLNRIVDLVKQVIGVPIAAVTLMDEKSQRMKAISGLDVTELPRPETFCNYTIAQKGPFAVNDALADPRFAGNPFVKGAPHIRSYIGVPLTTSDGYNIGTLCAVDTEPRMFDQGQGEIMRKLAEIAVEQFELQQIARHDSLTGALTRRGFFAELERELVRTARYERPSSLVMIDVDRFRMINERYGHAAGDAVLVSIANSCLAGMRRTDVFGRIGGEEFGLLLPETDAEEARDAAERIRAQIESTILQVGPAELRFTVSMGIAPVPGPGETISAWLGEADIALYESKQFGRNRVTVGKRRGRTVTLPDRAEREAPQLH
jgi:diguanylate cyclase (GGDEF)-like protein